MIKMMKYTIPTLKVVSLYVPRACCQINTSIQPRIVEESEFDEEDPS